MVECLLWEQDAAGSSPVTSTNYTHNLFLDCEFFCIKYLLYHMEMKELNHFELYLKNCFNHKIWYWLNDTIKT